MFIALGFFSNEGFDWGNLKYSGNALTSDENSHIPAGYYYLKTGKYFINPEHPPLVKDISGLPLLILNPTLPNISDDNELYASYLKNNSSLIGFDFPKELEIQNQQWDWGHIFLFNPNNNPDLITFWARLSTICFNALFLFLLYIFLSKLWGKRASLISIFLIIVSQFNIAHGSLVTMDFMSSILQIIAIVCFAIYVKLFFLNDGNFKYFLITVLFLSLALLSKFSSIILIPALFIGGLVYAFFLKSSWKQVGKYILRCSTILICTFAFISFFYYFHTRNMDNNEMIRQIVQNYPENLPFWGAEYLSGLIISNPIAKGLAEYLSGTLMVLKRMNPATLKDQSNYFLGSFYGAEGAGLWYFPVLYLTKTPVAILVLTVIGGLFSFSIVLKKRKEYGKFLSFVSGYIFDIILILFIFLYTAVTLSSNLQIGLRHILPVIFAISLLTARAIDIFWDKEILKIIKIKTVFLIASTWLVISLVITFPFYLSYYNIFGGGTENGYKIATDSNYDWGQDVKLFAKWVRENNINQIYTDVTTKVPLDYYLGDGREAYNYDIEWWGLPAAGSYIAVSYYEYQNNIYDSRIPTDKKYSILENNLVARIGKTILVFKVPEKQLNN